MINIKEINLELYLPIICVTKTVNTYKIPNITIITVAIIIFNNIEQQNPIKTFS